jgi:hypothetical protein
MRTRRGFGLQESDAGLHRGSASELGHWLLLLRLL